MKILIYATREKTGALTSLLEALLTQAETVALSNIKDILAIAPATVTTSKSPS
jgi:hypothetical protein